jgi:type I restriction enzyme, S subunit
MELRPGYEQTKVGVIPKDWEVVLLDSVARRGSGHTPDKKHPEYWDGSIKWISLKDSDRLDALYIEDTAAKITPAGIANSSATIHPAGTVVLSRDAGVGKSAIMNPDMAVSQHFIAWQCGPRLDNHFLYYWLQTEKAEFERIAMGNTIKTIGLPYFKKLCVPLPSCDEQRAIAGALGDVDCMLGGLTQLIAKKRDLKQAAMQQLLNGNNRLPGFTGQWEAKQLGEIAASKNGYAFRSASYTDLGEFKIITIANVQDGYMDNTECNKIASVPTDIQPHHKLRRGDILISMTGNVGRVCRVNEDNCLLNQRVGKLVATGVDDGLLFFLLSQRPFIVAMAGNAKGGAQGNLGVTDIATYQLHVPSDPGEQRAIAAVLSDIDAELAALEQRRDKTRALKLGMMQELLTGKTRLV